MLAIKKNLWCHYLLFFKRENVIRFYSSIHTQLFSHSYYLQFMVAFSLWFSSVVFWRTLEQSLLAPVPPTSLSVKADDCWWNSWKIKTNWNCSPLGGGRITENSELESEWCCCCASLRNNNSYTYKGFRHNDFRYAVLSYLLPLSCTKGSHWCPTLLFIVLHGLLALWCMLLQQ